MGRGAPWGRRGVGGEGTSRWLRRTVALDPAGPNFANSNGVVGVRSGSAPTERGGGGGRGASYVSFRCIRPWGKVRRRPNTPKPPHAGRAVQSPRPTCRTTVGIQKPGLGGPVTRRSCGRTQVAGGGSAPSRRAMRSQLIISATRYPSITVWNAAGPRRPQWGRWGRGPSRRGRTPAVGGQRPLSFNFYLPPPSCSNHTLYGPNTTPHTPTWRRRHGPGRTTGSPMRTEAAGRPSPPRAFCMLS